MTPTPKKEDVPVYVFVFCVAALAVVVWLLTQT